MCLVNGTRCEGAERMIMSFSCDSKEPNAICCVHAKEMAKIDISKERWQNNCTCDPDEKTEDSVCIDEVPPETKKYVLHTTLNLSFAKIDKKRAVAA
uniref:Uncharacterized protein n=1 Tax=Acrobeloides nanus TaxID=290746 RepID=A0A914DEV8_9BILA